MPKYTNRALLIAGLEALGAKQDTKARTTRYAVYRPTSASPLWLGDLVPFYVGKMGALRRGLTVAKSYSVSDRFRMRVIEAGRTALSIKAEDIK